jgi:hypothetical protein
MSTILGYIVNYFDEEEMWPYHGQQRLFTTFSHAYQAAVEKAQAYMEVSNEAYDGPFELKKPTKQDCDNQGSVVVFRSERYWIWIDFVYS